MKREAEKFAEEDRKKRELAETKNQADNLIYVAEKTLREMGEKISSDLKKEVEEKISQLKKAKEGDNIDEIKAKMQNLSLALQKIGAQMYGQGGQS